MKKRIKDLLIPLIPVIILAVLFVKNPFKLNKAMEFIGAGTFFAGMSLWPKLMIQAPVKARTGVDVHQKYIDSQGRKKMLFQDPQYVLTDLYSKEDEYILQIEEIIEEKEQIDTITTSINKSYIIIGLSFIVLLMFIHFHLIQ